MGIEYSKVKSVAKDVQTKGPKLDNLVLSTMKTIREAVGATLGPGGRSILIERYEHALPPQVTKDGVTVFRSLGFDNPAAHCIMEATRDAAVRTASEAGDGPQPLWSNVLTPTGFVKMGDIRVGMEICGTNGTVQKVLGVFPKGEKEIVRVEFEQGQVVECCEDHLWTVVTNYGSTKTITTKEMATDYRASQSDGSVKHKYYTPSTVVNFSQQGQSPLPLDPYLVGVLLGDGSLCDSGSVELSLGLKKKHILDKLCLPKGIFLKSSYLEASSSFRVKFYGTTENGESIRDLLSKIEPRNTNSYTKRIPKSYLMSSKENRERLLQGLVDTDGYINGRGLFEFSTVSESLASDFEFLCGSLGKSLYSKIHTRENDEGSYSDRPIFRFSELKGYKYGIKVVGMVWTGKRAPMQCIKVSNPDNLYITDSFIVTHNTTSATILAESIVRLSASYCRSHPRVSPQKVVRRLERAFREVIEPAIKKASIKADLVSKKGRELLRSVAKVSANGDESLANAVMDCFDITGDEGNVTITEISGSSAYEVEHIQGYPIKTGYEESCAKFYGKFINDPGTQMCRLEKPVFVLYHGRITEIQTVVLLLEEIGHRWQSSGFNHNVVLVATGFSETVLATLGMNFAHPSTINVFPLLVPQSPFANGQQQFLQDLSAITGADIFDPLNAPLDQLERDDEGNATLVELGPGLELFEASRFRSTIFGRADDDLLLFRIDQVKTLLENPESEYDKLDLQERLAKLTGGIAKLKVIGASNGELKEKRDRAEDAVCAVRGAIKHGCVPGGGWMLLKLMTILKEENDPIINEVLIPALFDPITQLFLNIGMNEDEIRLVLEPVIASLDSKKSLVYDALEGKHVDSVTGGILDSTPAVLEAIRNSISIAGLIGTLGGTVVFKRDMELERSESAAAASFMRNVDSNPANDRP